MLGWNAERECGGGCIYYRDGGTARELFDMWRNCRQRDGMSGAWNVDVLALQWLAPAHMQDTLRKRNWLLRMMRLCSQIASLSGEQLIQRKLAPMKAADAD